jgi:hypothetical protein
MYAEHYDLSEEGSASLVKLDLGKSAAAACRSCSREGNARKVEDGERKRERGRSERIVFWVLFGGSGRRAAMVI